MKGERSEAACLFRRRIGDSKLDFYWIPEYQYQGNMLTEFASRRVLFTMTNLVFSYLSKAVCNELSDRCQLGFLCYSSASQKTVLPLCR